MEAMLLLILVFSTGSNLICAQDQLDSKNEAETPAFEPVGCFNDGIKQPRPLPELIKNFRWPIKLDWSNLNLTIEACAREVKKKGYMYFGLQFYGECWSGPRAQETYDEDGESKHCIAGVGMAKANFVYKFKREELPQECSKSNYIVLDSIDRSMTDKLAVLKPCDYNLKLGWYRFDGKAGNAMANTCVSMYHCGTISPGWMQGDHPTVEEGVVNRQACFHQYTNQCCYKNVDIQVRNCGPFYMYKLPAAPSCQLRYCGNGQV